MSEYEEQNNHANRIAPLGAARLAINWIGAIASVALVIGLVYWVFNLGTRDPNDIPIIRAMEGPARTQPENPGGTQANHQGLAVNSVQSEGSTEKPAETVVLAPEQQSLTSEDLAQSELAAAKPELRPEPTPEAEPIPESTDVAKIEKPTLTIQDPSLIVESIVVENESTVISSSEYAPLQSPVPQSRPSNLSARIEAAAQVKEPEVTDPENVSSVPVGTRLVQLGAYDSETIAAIEWDKLIGKHGDLLTGKKRLIQSAESGGRTFFRLRAMGFDGVEDSRNLCSALLARGTPCIPVSAR